MCPRMRVQTPAGHFYKSTPAHEQVIFPARKKLVTYRRSTGSTKTARQETLTQMNFVNVQRSMHDEEKNMEESECETRAKKRKKGRRSEGDEWTRFNRPTKSLTELDLVSTPVTSFESSKTEDDKKLVLKENATTEKNIPAPRPICPPQTPSRPRIYEVPSSQKTDDSPFSVHGRSPLNDMIVNALPLLKFSGLNKIPQFDIKDTFEYSVESLQTGIHSTPKKNSSAVKSVRFTDNPESEPSSSKHMPEEIDDSEAESEGNNSDMEDEGCVAMAAKLSSDVHKSAVCYENLGPETQLETKRIINASAEMAPRPAVPQDVLGEEPTQSLATQEASTSQWVESQYTQGQRLSTQQVDSMAPRTLNSDIFIAIHPGPMESILNHVKDHEFRNYKLPDQVSRVWYYETKPASRVKYMVSISKAKQPGEIENTEGIGNEKFNASRQRGRYAYEVLQVYELADPLPFETLKANAWLDRPPGKYEKVRPAVLDALMANLKYVLFDASSSPEDLTDTQEAEAQLHNTLLQFTQAYPPQVQNQLPRASQATTVDLTQESNVEVDYEKMKHDEGPYQSVVPESPTESQAHTSSPVLPRLSGKAVSPHCQIPPTLLSSQLLTRSQMLPESLMNDSLPPPPGFICDSEEEDDEV